MRRNTLIRWVLILAIFALAAWGLPIALRKLGFVRPNALTPLEVLANWSSANPVKAQGEQDFRVITPRGELSPEEQERLAVEALLAAKENEAADAAPKPPPRKAPRRTNTHRR